MAATRRRNELKGLVKDRVASHPFEHVAWRTRDEGLVRIIEMDDDHIDNTIDWLRRELRVGDTKDGYTRDEWVGMLEAEIRRRSDRP